MTGYVSTIRNFVSTRLDLRRRPLRSYWQLWLGAALILLSIVFFSWQPTSVYATVNVCSWCYLGWTSGVGILGGWGVGTLGALIGWAMLAGAVVWSTWRADRPAPEWFAHIPLAIFAAAAVIGVTHIEEIIGTIGGIFSLNFAFGVPAFAAGVALWWIAFRRMGADLRLPKPPTQ